MEKLPPEDLVSLYISSCKRRGMTDAETELFLVSPRSVRISMLKEADEKQNRLYDIPPGGNPPAPRF